MVALALLGCGATSDAPVTAPTGAADGPRPQAANSPAPRPRGPRSGWAFDASKLRLPVNPQLGTPCTSELTYRPTMGAEKPVECGTDGRIAVEVQWTKLDQDVPCTVRQLHIEEQNGLEYLYGLCVVGERLYVEVPCLTCFAPGSEVALYELATLTPAQHAELRRELRITEDEPASAEAWAAFVAKL